ncbi:MAG: ATP-dependent helicase, partial [Oscillospiraceae bacterium]
MKNENFIIDYLMENHNITFNNQQQTALQTINGNILLIAVPGAGKTTVMVSRIANMIYCFSIDPESILTLTFSVSSAKDMKKRYESLFGQLGNQTPMFSTIHSFSLSVLKHYCMLKGSSLPTLIEGGGNNGLSKSKILRDIYKQINHEAISEDAFLDVCSDIGYVKNMCITNSEEISDISGVNNFSQIFEAYENFKLKNSLMDFDDMLCYAYTALRKYPKILNHLSDKYKYINIDEAQDTSKLQHKIINLVNKKNSNLFMVGDEDQSIYAFRGAFPNALIEFENTYENAIILKMEENFRSKEQIITCANRFISENKNRHKKTMIATQSNKGDETCVFSITLDNQELQYNQIFKLLCEFEKDKTVGILYRNNYCSVAIADYLHERNIDFKIREHKSFFSGAFAIRDIINFLKLSLDMTNYNAFSSVFYKTSFYLKRSLTETYNLSFYNGDNIFEILIDKLYDDGSNLCQKAEKLQRLVASLKSQKPIDAIDTIL